jgi:hypothetical protein
MKKLIILFTIICLPVVLMGQTTIKNNFVIERSSPSLHLKGSNGVINFNSGDITLTNTSNTLTIVGGVLALPANGLLINSINHLYGLTDTISDLYYTKANIATYLAGKQDTGVVSMTYPASGIALSTGSAWGTSITNNSTNWNTAYSDRLKWDGGSTDLVAATGRTSLGATTVGSAFFTLANPSAIRVPIIQTDNSVTATATTGTGNVVLSASPTLSGTVAIGTGSITMTGSLAATGSRVLKGWFTDLEVTNLPTVNGGTLKTALSLTSTDVGLGNVTNESKSTMFTNPTFTGVQKVSTTDTLATKAYARSVGGGIGGGTVNAYSDTLSISAGTLRTKVTSLVTEPYSIQMFTSTGDDITDAVSYSYALDGGVYKLYVYSVDALSGCKLKILY